MGTANFSFDSKITTDELTPDTERSPAPCFEEHDEALGEAHLTSFDDDPNPYAGTYSEWGDDDFGDGW